MSAVEKKLTARVSPEIHRQVRQAALNHGVTVDKFIEDAVLHHLHERNIGPDTLNTSKQEVATIAELPEPFLRDLAMIYNTSLDVFFALTRIVAAVARGASISEAISGPGAKDQARLGRVQEFPSDNEKKDKPA